MVQRIEALPGLSVLPAQAELLDALTTQVRGRMHMQGRTYYVWWYTQVSWWRGAYKPSPLTSQALFKAKPLLARLLL
jgi:hypothetical protein